MSKKIFLILMALCFCAVAGPPVVAAPKADQPRWDELFSDIAPCRVDALVFVSAKKRSMEKVATIHLEFPDNSRVFQDVRFTLPLAIRYKSYSRNGASVIHDLDTDRISFLSHSLLPLSIFSISEEDSIFSAIRFVTAPMGVYPLRKSIELEVESDDLWITPGITLQGATGHLWIDTESIKPVKLVLTGKVELDIGDVRSANLMMDFRYSGLSISTADWKKLDSSLAALEKKENPEAEKAIRKIEKKITAGVGGSGKK